MSSIQLTTPIAFIIFKRPEVTAKVFEAIRRAKPQKLYVIADGARPDRPGEAERCAATRAVIEQIDWDCQVFKNYADQNLGCKHRVSSGLDWVFSHEETAVILEDDCLPHPSFFPFCQELLERYRTDERIMLIGGDNSAQIGGRTPYSYFFSRYTAIWGWATWRRAWQQRDIEMKLWPEIREGGWLRDVLEDAQAVQYWTNLLQGVYDGKIDSWGITWTFTCWLQSGLCILPNLNLVSNLGFGQDATHTKEANSQFANALTQEIAFPLKHPPFVIRDTKADRLKQSKKFSNRLTARIKHKIRKLF